MEAVLAAAQKAGTATINGRPVQFIYHSYSLIDDSAAQTLCNKFAQDDKVFAVLAGINFTQGSECLAQRFHIPVIDATGNATSVYQQSGPDYFSLGPDQDVFFKAFVDWADANGYLKGKKIGVMYDSGEVGEASKAGMDELAAKGYTIAVKVDTGGAGVGSSASQVAVQKFQAGNVDLVIPFAGGSTEIETLSYADKQHYKPTVLDLDTFDHAEDVAAGAEPASIYNGTLALTYIRDGEPKAGMTLPDQAQTCLTNYNTFSGKTLSANQPWASGEVGNTLLSCDLAAVLFQGLKAAASPLTAASFVSGVEGISNLAASYGGTISFSPTAHWGYHQVRTVKFDSSCPCWVAQGSFSALG
jgi:ABC-type branched-subunit amino acid transport system substrate-binding protein